MVCLGLELSRNTFYGMATMSEQPYMKLWVGDFTSDTLHLSACEIGQYMMLLMAMWRGGGSLPNDPKFLRRITRGPVRPAVMAYFVVDGERITQKRLAVELKKAKEKSESAAESARAKYRKDKESPPANGHANAERSDSYHSHSHSYKKERGAKAPSRAHQIPKDWVPTENHFSQADKLGFGARQVADMAEDMRLWAGANGKVKKNWDLAFSGWMRRQTGSGHFNGHAPPKNGSVSKGPWKPLPSVSDPVKPPPEERERQWQRLLKARPMQ
jgi:uncharacterized protein YdaU (DUF1376 family)